MVTVPGDHSSEESSSRGEKSLSAADCSQSRPCLNLMVWPARSGRPDPTLTPWGGAGLLPPSHCGHWVCLRSLLLSVVASSSHFYLILLFKYSRWYCFFFVAMSLSFHESVDDHQLSVGWEVTSKSEQIFSRAFCTRIELCVCE